MLKCQFKIALFVLAFSCPILAASAQDTGAGYAAPGMPMRPLGRVAPGAVAHAPLVWPRLPRYWHQAGATRDSAAQPVHRFMGSHLKYPASTLAAGISGRLHVRLTVLPDGTVSQAVIVRRELTRETADGYDGPPESGKAALDQEALRVARALHFAPSRTAVDTVTVIQSFGIQ